MCTVTNADEDFIDAVIRKALQAAYNVPLRKTSTRDESSMYQVIQRINLFDREINAIFIRDKFMHVSICVNNMPDIYSLLS